MTDIGTEPNNQGQSQRPPLGFFRFLCILSVVFGILATLSYFFIGMFSEQVKAEAMKSLKGDEQKLILSVIETGKPFLLSSAFLYSISALGAYLMFYLRKTGFHLYAISQILLLIAPLVFIKGFPMSFMPVLVTASFILAYSGYLRFMK
jgi:hypothetical protein